jgi:hypothetical protein
MNNDILLNNKVCILISGYAYQYKCSIDNIINNIVIPNNADVYINIAKLNFIRGCNKNNKFEKINENLNETDIFDIKTKFGKYLKKLFIFDEDENYIKELKASNNNYLKRVKNFEKDNKAIDCSFYDISTKEHNYKNTNEQYFHLKKCMEMMLENNIEYDYVIRTRLDIRFNDIIDLEELKEISIVENNNININDKWTTDCFFCSSLKIMKNICLNFSNEIGSFQKNRLIINNKTEYTLCPETQLCFFLQENNLKNPEKIHPTVENIKCDDYTNFNNVLSYKLKLKNSKKNITNVYNNNDNNDNNNNNIIKAEYKSLNGNNKNVLDVLNNLINEKKYVINISNDLFGDFDVGVSKQLEIEYKNTLNIEKYDENKYCLIKKDYDFKIYLIVDVVDRNLFIDYCNSILLKFLEFNINCCIVNYNKNMVYNNKYIYIYLGLLNINSDNKNFFKLNTEQCSRKIIITNVINKSNLIHFDYDLYQSTIYNFHYMPYQINMKEINMIEKYIKNNNKVYDVCVMSNNTERRIKIYKELLKENINVLVIDAWNNIRDEKISKCKILLNIHAGDDYNIFEHLRCDRLVLSGQLIISEKSLSDDLLDIKDLIIMVDSNNLIDKIREVLENYDEIYKKFINDLNRMKNDIIKNREIELFKCYEILQNSIN